MKFNVTKIAKEVYQNFPEASAGSCLRCNDWDYGDKEGKPFSFKFVDMETDKTHTVDIKKAEKGVAKLLKLVLTKKLHFHGLDASNINEFGNWDAIVVDACVQCAIFGEVIYG